MVVFREHRMKRIKKWALIYDHAYTLNRLKANTTAKSKNGEIRIEEVAKNNGLRLTGISIPQGDQRAVPMVYPDFFH